MKNIWIAYLNLAAGAALLLVSSLRLFRKDDKYPKGLSVFLFLVGVLVVVSALVGIYYFK